MPPTGSADIVLRLVCALAALMVWVLAFALLFGALQESRDQSVLYAQFRQQLAEETAPTGGVIPEGKPVALLEIPRIGLRDITVEGTSGGDLLAGPGHRPDSPLPGEAGVSVLYGRGATFGAPFRDLKHVRVGDAIAVTDGAGVFRYVVTDIRRSGSPLPPPLAAGKARLTLATVTGTGWQAAWAPSSPLYVDALMSGAAAAEPGGHVASASASEKLMASDTSVLGSLVRWLQLLALVAVGTAWAFTRWGRWQAWIVGVPTLGAALWLVSETAIRLLPNVF
jgi:sortase A